MTVRLDRVILKESKARESTRVQKNMEEIDLSYRRL